MYFGESTLRQQKYAGTGENGNILIDIIFKAAARWAEVVIMSKVCIYVLDTFIQRFDRHR